MNPFFTIVTVCLNAGNSLSKTVESVISQKFTDYEYIIKDGLSIDGSLDRLDLNSNCFVVNSKDMGIYDAMNQGIECSRGKYILFLNAGDLFYNEYVLIHFYNSIINNKYPALVYSDLIPTKTGRRLCYPDKLSAFFLFRSMICHQTWMLHTEIFKQGFRFDSKYHLFGDYDLLLYITMKQKMDCFHMNEIGVIYQSEGFSSTNIRKFSHELREIQTKYFKKRYFMFKFFHLLTLPKLRSFIYNNIFISQLFFFLFCNYK